MQRRVRKAVATRRTGAARLGSGRLSTKAGQGRTRLETFYQEGCAKLRLPEMFDGTMRPC